MFVEVNTLKAVIVRPPTDALTDPETLDELVRQAQCLFLVDPDHIDEWLAWGSGKRCLILPMDFDFLFPIEGNLKFALMALGVEPYEAVYVTPFPDDLQEAINSRVGTVLIGDPHPECLPDFSFGDLREALEVLKPQILGSIPGYFGEVITTLFGRSPLRPVGRPGYLIHPRGILHPEVAERADVIALGRYFTSHDARHMKHQPTRRILRLKNILDEAFIPALAAPIEYVDERKPIDLITRVPPRLNSSHPDSLRELVGATCERLSRAKPHKPHYNTFFSPEALETVRGYDEQKTAGNFEDRQLNVKDAFRCNVRGSRHAVLVDDIITSGSTVAECARELLEAGFDFVTIVVLGITQGVITGKPDIRLQCPTGSCDGQLRIRFNKTDQGAFWGCSEWPLCKATLDWIAGLSLLNQQNLRSDLLELRDIPF